MRTTLIVFLTLFSAILHAQTVSKMSGNKAVVTVPEDSAGFSLHELVHFLDGDLNTTGHGEVIKLSPSGKSMLVQITSGHPQVGSTVETATKHSKPNKKGQPVVEKEERASPVVELSDEDRRILANGPIPQASYIIGGILGTYPGFGIGHAVQGRYGDRGWIFTVGEVGSFALIVKGLNDCFGSNWSSNTSSTCNNNGTIGIGVLGYIGFHVWEIVDVWLTPNDINRRYNEAKSRAQQSRYEWHGGIGPTKDGGMFALSCNF